MVEVGTFDTLAVAPKAGQPIESGHAFCAIDAGEGTFAIYLLVEGIHCANCIARIERSLQARENIIEARVNFSTRRLFVRWRGERAEAGDVVTFVEGLGYGAIPFDPSVLARQGTAESGVLLRALGVSGFAAANVMLLSISVWAGLWSDMEAITRDLLHWVSGLIALPAIAYAGRPFFKSALAAFRAGRTNMDVPISLAVLLAATVSLIETIDGGTHAYFDASITLVFFLLIGRYLDHRARAEARRSAERLLLLRATSAAIELPDGAVEYVPVGELAPGMTVHMTPGERFPVDGDVLRGTTEIDSSLVTGESLPAAATVGAPVFAGTLNLSAPVSVRVGKIGEDTLLGEIARLVEVAEQGRASFVRFADRVARWYAPLVHALAAGTFAGWLVLGNADWQVALLYAVAVLIITCPCALGLAVPVVQVVASGRLLKRGVLLRSGDALERLANVDTIVFDKTGTLTRGQPDWVNRDDVPEACRDVAAILASASNHPLSRAIQRAEGVRTPACDSHEIPGCGVTATVGRATWRLGRRDWCGAEAEPVLSEGPEIWLSRDGVPVSGFAFADAPRKDAAETVSRLKDKGYAIELLSGDRKDVVERVGAKLGIEARQGGCSPVDKVAWLRALEDAGHRVLMVGDGLNDAPALAAAHVSISPSTAADISQIQADLVFQGDDLKPVHLALDTGRRATALTRQNVTLAILYNAIAVPFAIAGFVTPLVAAVAMSSSSLLVTMNALRLQWLRHSGDA